MQLLHFLHMFPGAPCLSAPLSPRSSPLPSPLLYIWLLFAGTPGAPRLSASLSSLFLPTLSPTTNPALYRLVFPGAPGFHRSSCVAPRSQELLRAIYGCDLLPPVPPYIWLVFGCTPGAPSVSIETVR